MTDRRTDKQTLHDSKDRDASHRASRGKKSQKRNISHIWGKPPRKDIAMKFGIVVDVHDIVTWVMFDL